MSKEPSITPVTLIFREQAIVSSLTTEEASFLKNFFLMTLIDLTKKEQDGKPSNAYGKRPLIDGSNIIHEAAKRIVAGEQTTTAISAKADLLEKMTSTIELIARECVTGRVSPTRAL